MSYVRVQVEHGGAEVSLEQIFSPRFGFMNEDATTAIDNVVERVKVALGIPLPLKDAGGYWTDHICSVFPTLNGRCVGCQILSHQIASPNWQPAPQTDMPE